jgi:hypothetical protein
MKKIVSYSLWGNHPMYWTGALRNIEIVEKNLPDFICRFYIDKNSKPTLIDSIPENDLVEKILVDSDKESFYGMFWRFWAADDPEVDVILSRDCDSRIGSREIKAINEWLESDKDFHIMRDHPHHNVPILGGMWGARNGILREINISDKINQWTKFDSKGVDQDFLDQVIYPLVRDRSLVHDDWSRFGGNVKKFPEIRDRDKKFVGEIYDENDIRNTQHWKLL